MAFQAASSSSAASSTTESSPTDLQRRCPADPNDDASLVAELHPGGGGGEEEEEQQQQRQLRQVEEAALSGEGTSEREGGSAAGDEEEGEAAKRRYLAMDWVQRVVGPLNLSDDPTEEEFLRSLQDGRLLCNLLSKIFPDGLLLETPSQDFSDDVSTFLAVVKELKLPSFEATDLKEGSDRLSSCARVVDCLLSLRSYAESQKVEQLDVRRHHETDHSASDQRYYPIENGIHVVDLPQKSPQPRKRWAIPESGNFDDEYETSTINVQKSCEQDSYIADENFVPKSNQTGTGMTSVSIQQITHKFREILRMKSAEESTVLNSLDNLPSQSLVGHVPDVPGENSQDEVAGVVECMLKRVLAEFERRLMVQNEQVVKLKSMLKEHMLREDKLVTRAEILETLVAGAGEEVKIVSSQLQQIKKEKLQAEAEKIEKEIMIGKLLREIEEKDALVENLKKELHFVKQTDHERFQQLELEKRALEKKFLAELAERDVVVDKAKKKVMDLEANSAVEIKSLQKMHEQYRSFVVSQFELFQGVKRELHMLRETVSCLPASWQENLQLLEGQLQGLVHAASGYHQVLADNRQLYNEVQDLKGNIRVYCRVRPFLPGQLTEHTSVDFVGVNGDLIIHNPLKPQAKDGNKVFRFNKIFGPSVTQEEVFLDTQPLIRSVLDGFNVCIFAYGQTGSGKTYTMSGPDSMLQEDWGVNYRALDDLFHISQSRKDVISYEVGVQMIEIYNEKVQDLLSTDGPNRKLEIRNNSQLNGLNVPDACMLPVNSTEDVLKLMKIGQKNRAVGTTALNEHSSRSHSVLTVHVRGLEIATGSLLHGCLHLVDLAGSERVVRSEAKGERLIEAQHINKSLSALGDVIYALAQKKSHVPYRNSKLTQLLQDSLGGQAKTLMFVHISPDVESYGETISTLKFAERVSSVELGAARSNKESRDLRELREQVTSLKEQIARRDSEIFRLQTMKSTISEGLATSKIKSNNSSLQKTYADGQRRQTIDMLVQKEAKYLAERPPQDFEVTASSPTSSSRQFRAEPPSTSWNEASFRKLKLTSGSMSDLEEVRDGDETVEWESQCLSKGWRDTLQSSTDDSSVLVSGTVDDACCSWDSERNGGAESEVFIGGLPSSSEGPLDDDPVAKDLDTVSEISEGDISQAGSTSSLSSQKSFSQQERMASKRRLSQRTPATSSVLRQTKGSASGRSSLKRLSFPVKAASEK